MGKTSGSNRLVSAPYLACNRAMKIAPSAMEEISPAKCASCRPSSGRNATRSMISPRIAPTAMTIGTAAQIEMPVLVTTSMPTRAPAENTAAWARLSRSSTPKTRV